MVIFTYADYRFKIYFEGQGDSGAGGRPEYQFDGYSDIETITDDNGNATIKYDHTFTDSAKTNRGVIFAPNPNRLFHYTISGQNLHRFL